METSYKDAGVNVESGYEAVRLMKEHVTKTFNANVLGGLGSFGGFYALDKNAFDEPVLVAGTDGVGTKLMIAFLLDQHDTVGQDCVAMCVNDIVCQGAKPLFFLDYIATGKLNPDKVAQIVKGISDGCLQAGCALIGGETAEMPGFYPEEEYDLAGFAVGMADRKKIINGAEIKVGDALVGLSSSGLHSNGYSLVRKLLLQDSKCLNQYITELGCTLGEELLKPTTIYVKTVLAILEQYKIKGIAHITGGGFIENIPRMMPQGLKAKIVKGSWLIHPIFDILQRTGQMPEHSIYNTFNMGVGMVMAVESSMADQLVSECKQNGQNAWIIGEVVEGEAGVELCL